MFLFRGYNYTLTTFISPSLSCFSSWGTSNVSPHQECFVLTLCVHWKFREEGSWNAEIYSTAVHRLHTVKMSQHQPSKPAGSQQSFGLSGVETLMKTPWQMHNKKKQGNNTFEGRTLRKCQDVILLLTRRACSSTSCLFDTSTVLSWFFDLQRHIWAKLFSKVVLE